MAAKTDLLRSSPVQSRFRKKRTIFQDCQRKVFFETNFERVFEKHVTELIYALAGYGRKNPDKTSQLSFLAVNVLISPAFLELIHIFKNILVKHIFKIVEIPISVEFYKHILNGKQIGYYLYFIIKLSS
jgi:hypothetical protein